MFWKKFISYLTFSTKGQPSAKGNVNLKLMHGINRISIFMFVIAIIVMLVRHLL